MCAYHNDEFGFSVEFPKGDGDTICVPDNPGGRNGARLLFRPHANCEKLEEPGIAVSAEYNALHWRNSSAAAKMLCTNGDVMPSSLMIDALPTYKCERTDQPTSSWNELIYIAISSPSATEDGLIITVSLTAPTVTVKTYEPTILKVLRAVKLRSPRSD
jgi:hypothetical protein